MSSGTVATIVEGGTLVLAASYTAAGLGLDLSAAVKFLRLALGRPIDLSAPPGLPFYLMAWLPVAGVQRASGRTLIPNAVFLALIALHFAVFGWMYLKVLRRELRSGDDCVNERWRR